MRNTLLIASFFVSTMPFSARALIIDDFERQSIRIADETRTNPERRLLWNLYENSKEDSDRGEEDIASTDSYNGSSSLRVRVEKGNAYLQFLPRTRDAWHFMREYIENPREWKINTYNRMRFWIKVPEGISKADGGRANMHVGTYIRSSSGDKDSAESGGDHFYHYYNIPYTGEWHQIIVDPHPNHRRGAEGGLDEGVLEYPTGERGMNYFDLLTRFYVDMRHELPRVPADFYFDHFEIYKEKERDNIEQVYSVHGTYVPSRNEIIAGWMRNKDDNEILHEVRYAFFDIHNGGWNNAIPHGAVKARGAQGWNAMEWSTRTIDLRNHDAVYVAIKPENSNLFRQIKIPLRDKENSLVGSFVESPLITQSLAFGTSNDDVSLLQRFLMQRSYLHIPQETGYFGILTMLAVEQYQCDRGIVCGGDARTTGFGVVGPRTRKSVNNEL